jgi:MoaA/NifB/PqqE/SkfB family radical SAM enzyme
VVVWDLSRPDPGEGLPPAAAIAVAGDLARVPLPVLVLAAGPPARADLFDIAAAARRGVRRLVLSTDGAGLAGGSADRLAEIGVDRVEIALAGIGHGHDRACARPGAWAEALAGLRACRRRGIPVGLRVDLSGEIAGALPELLDLCDAEGVSGFSLGHSAGRGGQAVKRSRRAMDLLIDRAWVGAAEGMPLDIVTGNAGADAVHFLRWAERRFDAGRVANLRAHLEARDGERPRLARIDARGRLHAGWSGGPLGDLREASFSRLWAGATAERAARGPAQAPTGPCAGCAYAGICGGPAGSRALRVGGDAPADAPACYLQGAQTGGAVGDGATVLPFRRRGRTPSPRFV